MSDSRKPSRDDVGFSGKSRSMTISSDFQWSILNKMVGAAVLLSLMSAIAALFTAFSVQDRVKSSERQIQQLQEELTRLGAQKRSSAESDSAAELVKRVDTLERRLREKYDE